MPNMCMNLKRWGLLVMLLLCLPIGALAAKVDDLWVTASMDSQAEQADSAKMPLDAIRCWYSSKEKAHILFLPAGVDPAGLRLWFSGPDTLAAGKQKVNSGDAVDFLVPGEKIRLASGNDAYTLKVMQSANIPAMFLSTASGSVESIHKSKDNEEKGRMAMLDAAGSLLYDGELSQIKGRGNYTFTLSKKPYQIKLDKAADLCGLGEAKTWILLANHFDNSLLRNKIVFDLADAVGLSYSSRSQAVDLYVNNDYCGSYLLCEKVEIGNARIDITDLEKSTEKVNDAALDTYPKYGKPDEKGKNKGYQIPNDPEDITGGYLMELDYKARYKDEPSGFITSKGQPVVIKEPKAASKAQMEYISAFMQGFENAVFAKDGKDSKTGKHYSEFVDMDSLVKKYLVEEIVKNFDANRSSLYYYKPSDKDSVLAFAGPVWDYDIAIGNYAIPRNQRVKNPKYFVTNSDSGAKHYWFPALYRQPDFKQAAIDIYHESFVPALNVLLGNEPSGGGDLRALSEYAAEIEASAAMNFIRWPIFNSPFWEVETGKNYPENIEYIRAFFEGRMAFLAESWPR